MTVFGNPVAVQVNVPTDVDMQSAVLWTSGLKTSIRKTAEAAAVIGPGSGEAYQLCLTGKRLSSCKPPRATPYRHGL